MKFLIKIFLTMCCILTCFSFSSISVFASESDENLIYEKNGWVFRVTTYEEMIKDIAEIDGITIERAYELYPNKETKSTTSKIIVAYRAIDVTPVYRPRVEIRLRATFVDGEVVAIEEILHAVLDRKSTVSPYIVRQFNGNLIFNKEDDKTIFLALSGDFYNYGTTTMTGSINKGIFKFTISGASNHYSPVDFEEYLVIK